MCYDISFKTCALCYYFIQHVSFDVEGLSCAKRKSVEEKDNQTLQEVGLTIEQTVASIATTAPTAPEVKAVKAVPKRVGTPRVIDPDSSWLLDSDDDVDDDADVEAAAKRAKWEQQSKITSTVNIIEGPNFK